MNADEAKITQGQILNYSVKVTDVVRLNTTEPQQQINETKKVCILFTYPSVHKVKL